MCALPYVGVVYGTETVYCTQAYGTLVLIRPAQTFYERIKLLIIDELGFVPLSKTGAELLFEVFSQRYERGSVLVTSK